MSNPSVEDMVRAQLRTIGADGLCCDECGCGLDDLAPCGEISGACEAAVKRGDGYWPMVPVCSGNEEPGL